MKAAVATPASAKTITSPTMADETAMTIWFRSYHLRHRFQRPVCRGAIALPATHRSRSRASAAADLYRWPRFLLQAFQADRFQFAVDQPVVPAKGRRRALAHPP